MLGDLRIKSKDAQGTAGFGAWVSSSQEDAVGYFGCGRADISPGSLGDHFFSAYVSRATVLLHPQRQSPATFYLK